MGDFCPRCQYIGLMMGLTDGSSTRFCGCGFVFHGCGVHPVVVAGQGPPDSHPIHCSCPRELRCSCGATVAMVYSNVLYCQPCQRHYKWDDARGLYISLE